MGFNSQTTSPFGGISTGVQHMKNTFINIRVAEELKQAISEARQEAKPQESETQFVERACWERIKRIKKGKG